MTFSSFLFLSLLFLTLILISILLSVLEGPPARGAGPVLFTTIMQPGELFFKRKKENKTLTARLDTILPKSS